MEEKILKSLKLRLKNLTDEEIQDLLSDVITDVREYIHAPSDSELPTGCESTVKELVMIKANRLGAEGIASESHSGVSQSYESDIPPNIKRKLNLYRRLP